MTGDNKDNASNQKVMLIGHGQRINKSMSSGIQEALSNPKMSIVTQKCQKYHPYTGKINSETSEDSENTFLHGGDVLGAWQMYRHLQRCAALKTSQHASSNNMVTAWCNGISTHVRMHAPLMVTIHTPLIACTWLQALKASQHASRNNMATPWHHGMCLCSTKHLWAAQQLLIFKALMDSQEAVRHHCQLITTDVVDIGYMTCGLHVVGTALKHTITNQPSSFGPEMHSSLPLNKNVSLLLLLSSPPPPLPQRHSTWQQFLLFSIATVWMALLTTVHQLYRYLTITYLL